MKKRNLLFCLTAFFMTFFGFSQEGISDQNPNYKKSMDVYLNANNETILLQGTTSQETYKAVNPLQDRRDLRKRNRENRLLWRHQERLERAKNTHYIDYGYQDNYYNGYYNNNWSNFGSILGFGLLCGLIF